MEGSDGIAALASELGRAVEITMDSSAMGHARMEAYAVCERFKELSPLCAQAGLFLASGDFSSVIKHFGLQLMEYTVKYKWNYISQQEKIFIKENSMRLLHIGVISSETGPLLHIKDALSRIIVEMIKREWPQQWPTLLEELSDACAKGEAQTELVLMIFLRLVEDVALLQTLESNQRRKDIYQALTVNMKEIFDFFLRLVELHFGLRNGNDQSAVAAHNRVVQGVLLTLTGFVEWVSIQHIMAQDGRLLQILCILLNDEAFQVSAAECLLQITNRKGQIKDRKPLLLLLSEEAMGYMYRAANTNQYSESQYLFLKKLIQVLTGLASQITALWGKEDGLINRPIQFGLFLETVLLFTKHPSLSLTHSATLIWNAFMKHEQIAKDPEIIEYLPKVIEVVGPKVIKLPYPTSRIVEPVGGDPLAYICIDCDSESEFAIFFYRCRSDILEIFRLATLACPLVTFGYCEHWLNMRLQKSLNEQNTSCHLHDPIYLEWEALGVVLDSVLSRILLVTERPSVTAGLKLLEGCLKIESNNPLIHSVLLSCISSLFVFLSMSSCQITSANCITMSGGSLLPKVLEKIFAALIFTEPSSNEQQFYVRSTKTLHRHAASLLVKLSYKYPLLLLPVFDQINSTVQRLIYETDQISKNNQVTLQEALLLISNNFCDYEKQTQFIATVIKPAQEWFYSMSTMLKSSHDYIKFVGLNAYPVTDLPNDERRTNRNRLCHALNIVLGIIKRCSWPDDPDRAARGGFVIGLTENGNPIFRNPATPHVLPLLPYILSLLKLQHALFCAEERSLIDVDYANANSMSENEKKHLMGISPLLIADTFGAAAEQIKPKTAADRMQIFLTMLFENSYHMLGAAGPSLGRDIFQLPGIAGAIVDSCFSHFENIPDHRLRPIIRVFMKPFVYSCSPTFYETVLIPLFSHVTPIMLARLTNRWQYIALLYKSGVLGGDGNNTEEVIEDVLNKALTREYLDVLKIALVGGNFTVEREPNNFGSPIETPMDDDTLNDMPPLTKASQLETISDLGSKLIRNESTRTPIVLTLLSVLSWNDSISCFKATLLTGTIVKFLTAEDLLTPTFASNLLIAILQGLQHHGQHEANQSSLITLGVQAYEIIRPKFPNIIEIMHQIPNVNPVDIQRLDEKLGGTTTKGNKIDKAKKDLFKKITAHLIGKNLGQLFRKEIHINNLPPMLAPPTNGHNSCPKKNIDEDLSSLFTP